jgi:cellulose synthase/poly-beta-1,6-N-acetylglucosamine synthase-like glycosyltransferase
MVFDVVVPAHDEEAVLPDLLRSLAAQVGPARPGRVVVVADHCSDATAEVARRHGAEVLVRDDGRPGKPPSLEAGIRLVGAGDDRGDAVVLLDADCVVAPDFLTGLSRRWTDGVGAVQAAYTVEDPSDGAVRTGLRLGFALRNVVRPTGGDRLGLPCMLFGSGIALSWAAVGALRFDDPRIGGTGDSRPVADDVAMAYDLVAAGHRPRFAEHARVWAAPPEDAGLGPQRLRWELGQVLLWRRALATLPTLVRRGDVRGAVALVDWTAPPLAATVSAFAVVGAGIAGSVAVGALAASALLAPVGTAAALGIYLAVGTVRLEGSAGLRRVVTTGPRFLGWKLRLYRSHRTSRHAGTAATGTRARLPQGAS